MPAAFVYALAKSVDPKALLSAITQAHFGWLALGLGSLAVGYALRIYRWYLLLLPANENLRIKDCCTPLLGSFALNNILPARAGDVVRVSAFLPSLGTGAAMTLGSVMLERLLDLMTLIAALMFGIALVPTGLPEGMQKLGGWLGGAILLGIVADVGGWRSGASCAGKARASRVWCIT